MRRTMGLMLSVLFVFHSNVFAKDQNDYIGLRDLDYSRASVKVAEGIVMKEKVGFDESLGQYQLLQWDMDQGDVWDDGKGGLIQHKKIYKTVVMVDGRINVTIGQQSSVVENDLGSADGTSAVIHLMPFTPHKIKAESKSILMICSYERKALLGRDSLNWLGDTYSVEKVGTDNTFGEVRRRDDFHYSFEGSKIANYRLKVATYEAGGKLEIWNFIAAKEVLAMKPNPEGSEPEMVPIINPWHDHESEVETFIMLRGKINVAFNDGEKMPEKPLTPNSELWEVAGPGTVVHVAETVWHGMGNFYFDASILIGSPLFLQEEWFKEDSEGRYGVDEIK